MDNQKGSENCYKVKKACVTWKWNICFASEQLSMIINIKIWEENNKK